MGPVLTNELTKPLKDYDFATMAYQFDNADTVKCEMMKLIGYML